MMKHIETHSFVKQVYKLLVREIRLGNATKGASLAQTWHTGGPMRTMHGPSAALCRQTIRSKRSRRIRTND